MINFQMKKKKYTAPIKTFAPKSDEILSSVGKAEQAKGEI